MYDLTETMEETTMKRNLLIAIAVTAFMLATTIAQATDFEFSGKFRPRFEIFNDADDATSSRPSWDTRARLNAKAKVNANTEVFLQFQARGVWGNAGASSGTRGEGATNGTMPVNDAVDDVGLHQGYVTLKGFMGQAVDLKLGRQEIVFEGHRLLGNTIWTQGGQTNDAVRFNHSAGNHELNLIYIETFENGIAHGSVGDNRNSSLWVARAATQGVLGGNLAGYFILHDENYEATGENQWYTIGARQAGKLSGLDYRVEYYHQFGDGAVPATSSDQAGAYGGTLNNNSSIDRDAYLFGIRVGKTFKNTRFSPTITLWYDQKSGNDDDDVNGNDYGAYNTVLDTGHKFYGLLDNYLSDVGDDTQRYGLEDIAIKAKFNVSEKNVFKIDWHQFLTQTDLEGDDSDTIRADSTAGAFNTSHGRGVLGNDLGQEIDLTLVHKYDANTKIVTGYSHYFTTLTHSLLNGSAAAGDDNTLENNDDQSWFYVMIDTTF